MIYLCYKSSSTVCVSIPIQGWHLSIETWPSEVGSLQDRIRAHVDCRTWPLETGKPIGKIFSTTSLSKDLLPLFSSQLIQIFPFSETIPLSPFDHTKIRLMRPLQEVQDIRQLRPLRNEEDFTERYNNGNYNGWRIWRLGEFEGSEEFPDWYDLGKLPLWNLSDY